MWVKTLQRGVLLGATWLVLVGCSSQPLGPSADQGRREARLVTEADEELAPVVLSNNRFTWSAYQAGIELGQNLSGWARSAETWLVSTRAAVTSSIWPAACSATAA